MAENISELLVEIQDLTAKLEVMGFGGETESVTHNSVTRPTLQKAIEDKFLMLQSFIQGQLAFETKALMEADLNHAADVIARVWNDTVENCGIYGKLGVSGSGSWIKSNYDPLSFSFKAGFSNAALNAGFEPVVFRQYHAAGGAVITTDSTNTNAVFINKGVTSGSNGVFYGAWIEVNYESIDDLDAEFIVDVDHLSGGNLNTMIIVKGKTDWGPSSESVAIGDKFNAPINIYQEIMSSGNQDRIDYYSSVKTLYIAIVEQSASVEANNAATANFKIRARFNRAGVVVASALTADLAATLDASNQASASALIAGMPAPEYSKNAGIKFLTDADVYPQAYRDITLAGRPGAGGVIATKNVEAGSYTWYGLRISIHYAALIDLDAEFYINYEHISGTAPNVINFVTSQYGDWSSANNPVHFVNFESGPINLYDLIVAEGKEGIYETKDTLYLNLAVFNSNDAVPPSLESVWKVDPYFLIKNSVVIASRLTQELEAELLAGLVSSNNHITCWGDSLTAGGGWTTTLENLSGLVVHNGGTGGEKSTTIMARQGADAMVTNNITIPADLTPVIIADRDVDVGISTLFGNKVTPLLQGGTHHVNPVLIGDVEGALAWTGSGHSDMTGNWTFTRAVAGSEVTISRPATIRTNYDRLYNSGIQVVFIGQNGGWSDVAELVWQNRKMIEHSGSEKFVILGLSSGSAAFRADYEAAMKGEFGRRFISLREYLAAPIYDIDGTTIISCYGLDDAGLTPTQADLDAIATGTVPPQCLSDSVHYTTATKTVIGEMLFKKMTELNFFN